MNRNITRKSEYQQNSDQFGGFMNLDSFLSKVFVATAIKSVLSFGVLIFALSGCNSVSNEPLGTGGFNNLNPSNQDELLLADGFTAQVLIKGMDTLRENDLFGYDVSGLYFDQIDDESARLIVNHELMNPMLATGFYGDMARMRKQIKTEQIAVGVTSLEINRDGNRWVVNSAVGAEKITADVSVPFDKPVNGKTKAKGTVANRSVIKTSWNSYLSTESVYQEYYGDIQYGTNNYVASRMQWESFVGESPYLYGWIVEADDTMEDYQKLTAPGRLRRGGVALTVKDGMAVLYSTDKRAGGCLYKFVSDAADNLENGEIYVADFENSQWKNISYGDSLMSNFFGSEAQVLTELSLAGKLAGGSPLDNPAGLAIDPESGDLLMAVMHDIEQQKYHGSVLRITEGSGGFSWDTVIEGSIDNNISSPSRLTFDQSGNLWIATAIPAALQNQGVYKSFGNNGLFVLPKGQTSAIQIASAPVDAKFSGISFSADEKFLFLGVQQPGSRSTSIYDFDFTSHWPEGGKSKPRSAVVIIGREG
ncbi:MAG: alkaline phosphatase PhoX [Bacteroidota bacterium]